MRKLCLLLLLPVGTAISQGQLPPTELSALEGLGFSIQAQGHRVVDIDLEAECAYQVVLEHPGNDGSADRPEVRTIFLSVLDKEKVLVTYTEIIAVEETPIARTLRISDRENVSMSMVVEIMEGDEPQNVPIDLSAAVVEAQKGAVVPEHVVECSEVSFK
jgi:hypothetical protein